MSKTLISVLAGLGGMFGWGTSDFLASLSSDKIGHYKTFFWSQFVGMIFIFFLVPFFGINTTFPVLFLILIIVASVFYTVAYLFFYKAFEVGNVSIVSASINLWAVTTMIFAFIFLGQRLSSLQFFAVLMIIGGVILVSVNFQDLKNWQIKLLSGVKETLIAALLFGVFWNLSEVISEKMGWLATTLFIKIGAVLSLILFSLLFRRHLNLGKIGSKAKLIIGSIGILEALAVASVNYGLTVGDVILITPISSALSVVTILMAVAFLKEKLTKIQAFGVTMTILGIVLTAF